MTDFSVAATLDAHIERTDVPRPPDGRWHPSAIFSCARQAVYAIRGIDESDIRDNRSRRILRQGTALHEIVQRAMTEDADARAVYNEVEVQMPELGVYGHCDTLLEYADDTYELLEFKSIGVKGMEFGLRKGELPKADHEKQARTYAMGLRLVGGWADTPDQVICRDDCGVSGHIEPLGDRLARIRIVYFSRDDLRIEEFKLTVSEAWEQEFTGYIARLDEYVADGTALPPRLPLDAKGQKNWLCKDYCLWRTRCWDIDTEGVNL